MVRKTKPVARVLASPSQGHTRTRGSALVPFTSLAWNGQAYRTYKTGHGLRRGLAGSVEPGTGDSEKDVAIVQTLLDFTIPVAAGGDVIAFGPDLDNTVVLQRD
jgi:hypothetical protein